MAATVVDVRGARGNGVVNEFTGPAPSTTRMVRCPRSPSRPTLLRRRGRPRSSPPRRPPTRCRRSISEFLGKSSTLSSLKAAHARPRPGRAQGRGSGAQRGPVAHRVGRRGPAGRARARGAAGAARVRAARPVRGGHRHAGIGHRHLVTQTRELPRGRVRRHGLHRGGRPRDRDRLVQLRGAQHAAGHPARSHVGHALPRGRRARDGAAAHPHVAGAGPHDARRRSRPSTSWRPARCSARTPPTPRTSRCSTRSRAWSSTATSRSPTWPAPSRRS